MAEQKVGGRDAVVRVVCGCCEESDEVERDEVKAAGELSKLCGRQCVRMDG